MASHGVAVLDVVVGERKVVDDLDRGGGRDDPVQVPAGGLAGQQTEQRAQPLAAWPLDGLQPFVDPAQVIVHHAIVRAERTPGRTQQPLELVLDGR
jgi:hypothetical protein